MTRLQRLASALSLVATVVLGAAFSPPPGAAANRASVTVADVASQLGVTIAPVYERDDFIYGAQFTGSLKDPEKLAALGLPGFHGGARVVAAYVAPGVVYVEADEQAPAHKANVKIHIDDAGRLAP